MLYLKKGCSIIITTEAIDSQDCRATIKQRKDDEKGLPSFNPTTPFKRLSPAKYLIKKHNAKKSARHFLTITNFLFINFLKIK